MKRITNSFKGILAGIIFILVGIGLLWFNEANNVENIKAVAEGRNVAINITSSPIKAENDGKLVNINGDLNIVSGEVKDTVFNIETKTVRLVRTVEMYQWAEDEDEDEDGNKTYTYKKEWTIELIDAGDFNQPNGHQNPTIFPYESTDFLAYEVGIGDFKVSDQQKQKLSANTVVSPIPETAVLPINYQKEGKYIFLSTDINSPQVGDVRVSFTYNNDSRATILAKQSDENLLDYTTESGKIINMIRGGEYTALQMLDYLETQNNMLKWILRLVGTLLIIAGIAAILKPIVAIASFVPLLGNIVGVAVGLVALLLGIAISLITIAIAWIVYRPLLGIALLAGVVIILIILGRYLHSKKKVAPAQNVYKGMPNPTSVQQSMPNPTSEQQPMLNPTSVQQPMPNNNATNNQSNTNNQ